MQEEIEGGSMVNQYKIWSGLYAFHAVATTSNISVSAPELGKSQSALSRQISGFEKEVGVKLFKRESRGVSLTAEGAQLFSLTRQAFIDIRSKMARVVSIRASIQSKNKSDMKNAYQLGINHRLSTRLDCQSPWLTSAAMPRLLTGS
jgi:Bacterial regulatory helix-turn-helix protein, lysR family